jgi:hypothetical protein
MSGRYCLLFCLALPALLSCSNTIRNANPTHGWVRFTTLPDQSAVRSGRTATLKVWSPRAAPEVPQLCQDLHMKLKASRFFSSIVPVCDGSGVADYLLEVQIVDEYVLLKKDVFWRKPFIIPDPYIDTVVTLTEMATGHVAMEAKVKAVTMFSGWSGEGTEDIIPHSAEYTVRAIFGHEGL